MYRWKLKKITMSPQGGFYGERLGWHLPGFDDSAWPKTSSLANDAPGVRFFRTTFDLSLPIGHDVRSCGGPFR